MSKHDGKVTVGTGLDNKGLEKGIGKISGSLGGLKTVVGKLGGIMVAAFSVKAIVDFGKAAIELGSNLEEVQNVVDVSFGSMAGAAEEFASTAITKFGMSELAAKQTASTYMAMAKGMGVAEEAASDMSITLAGLSGDVASFYNLDQEDAAKKLQGVFTGESEALKSLGVVMTQTNLKQFALEKGMNSNIETMSQAELVALRYAFVTDALSLAAGDFERTQDSWANQTRILSMQWQQFMGIMGQTLTTVLAPAVKLLNSLVGALVNVAQKVQTVVSSLFGKTITQTNEIASSANEGAEAEEEFANSVKEAGTAAKKSLAGFDELNTLQSDTGNGDANSTTSIGGGSSGGSVTFDTSGVNDALNDTTSIFDAFITKIKSALDVLKTVFSPTISAFTDFGAKIGEAVNNALPSFNAGIEGYRLGFGNIFTYLTEDFIPNMVNSWSTNILPIFGDVTTFRIGELGKNFEWLGETFNNVVNDIITPALDTFQNIATGAMEGVKTAWDKTGGELLTNLSTAFEGIRNTIDTFYQQFLKPVIDTVLGWVNEMWTKHLKPLWDNLVSAFLDISNNLTILWNKVLKPVVDWVLQKAYPQIKNAIDLILSIVGTLIEYVTGVINGIIKVIKGIIAFITGVFTGDWEKAWKGIKDIVGGIWDMIWAGIKGTVNLIIDGINALWSGIYYAVKGIVDTIGDVAGVVGDLLGQDWRFSMPSKPPLIPKLAQGAVLPPNKPFLAMVGDQRHGTNVEAPLSTIQEAVALVMNDQTQAILAGFEASVGVQREILEAVLGIQIGDDVIGNAVARYSRKQAVMRGGAL